jgi:hypothetical protein
VEPAVEVNRLFAVADLAEAELNQVLRFESAARPSVSLLKLDANQIIRFFEFAVFYSGLTAVAFELQRNNGIGRDGLFEFKTCTRSGDIFQNCPFTARRTEFRFPLHFNQIRTKFSLFSSFSSHD